MRKIILPVLMFLLIPLLAWSDLRVGGVDQTDITSVKLGTFTGSTIPDESTVPGALQSLETEVESKEPTQTPASQAEAGAGSESGIRSWSPLRVFQGVASWWNTTGRLAPGDIGGPGGTPAAGYFTTINGGILRVEQPATDTLTTQEMRGTLITNYGQTVANTQTCPTLTGELNGIVQIEATGVGAFYLKAGPNDRIGISVGGVITWTDDGDKVGFAAPAVGDSFSYKTIRVGASAYDMIVYPNEGTLVDGGA